MPVQILIAEDEALVALSLADILEAEGYEVDLASDGKDALGAAQRLGAALQLLVTDLRMPHLCGVSLIRILRERVPDLPVVVVTGSPPPGGAETLRHRVGGHGHLALLLKPFSHLQLAEAARTAITARAQEGS